MIVSSFKSREQLRLFDRPIPLTAKGEPSHAYARNIAGELCEELTALLFNGRRHKTDSRCDYCPDVSVIGPRGIIYLESKSAGLSRQTFIYEGRLRKDIRFSVKRSLYYVIWHHLATTKQAHSEGELRSLLLQKMVCAYVIPFVKIKELCLSQSLENLNSKYGGTDRKTYGKGYRLNLRDLEEHRTLEWSYDSQT